MNDGKSVMIFRTRIVLETCQVSFLNIIHRDEIIFIASASINDTMDEYCFVRYELLISQRFKNFGVKESVKYFDYILNFWSMEVFMKSIVLNIK